MCNALSITASFTAGSNESTLPNCSTNCNMCLASAFILRSPSPCNGDVKSDSIWILASSPVIFPNPLNISLTMFSYVFFSALFALVEMTVSHH